MSVVAVAALVFFTPLFLGSLYQVATAGFSPINVLGVIALLGIVGAVKRLRDDRRDALFSAQRTLRR